MEIQQDAIDKGNILIADDLIATGGTAFAADDQRSGGQGGWLCVHNRTFRLEGC